MYVCACGQGTAAIWIREQHGGMAEQCIAQHAHSELVDDGWQDMFL